MVHLIDKAAVVAEIDRRINTYKNVCGADRRTDALMSLKNYIDTLEVTEVNLEKEIDRELETRWRGEYIYTKKFRESAKHFFELGLKAQKGEGHEV